MKVPTRFGIGCSGSTTTGPKPTGCVTTIECSTDEDCGDEMYHCNLALMPAVCQKVFCGELGSACSEPALCEHQYCPIGFCGCERDCSTVECGPDPECGLSCGLCDDEFKCEAGVCVPDPCVPECGDAVCGLNPVCGDVCGTCEQGFGCEDGRCVELAIEQEMITIPAGQFWMGCDEDVDSDCQTRELPHHLVNLSEYQIDKMEVTLSQYADCVNASVCTEPYWDWKEGCNWGEFAKINNPVTCVDWTQAKTYCEWLGKRLPTEAEWEKAARGDDGRRYPWGNEDATCEYSNFEESVDDGCGTGTTADVCSRSPKDDSPYGLCDMAGNVWEWVYDRYQEDYYSESPTDNPTGPGDDTNYYNRVVRGGSFMDYWFLIRLTHRNCYFDSYIGSQADLGFRCARTPTTP